MANDSMFQSERNRRKAKLPESPFYTNIKTITQLILLPDLGLVQFFYICKKNIHAYYDGKSKLDWSIFCS